MNAVGLGEMELNTSQHTTVPPPSLPYRQEGWEHEEEAPGTKEKEAVVGGGIIESRRVVCSQNASRNSLSRTNHVRGGEGPIRSSTGKNNKIVNR